MEALWLALGPVLGRITFSLLLAVAAMFVFVKLAHEIVEGGTRQFDFAVLHFFRAYRHTPFNAVMKAVSWLAGGGPQSALVLLTASVFALRRRWLEAGTMLLAGVGGLGVIIGLKRLFHRPRPEEIFSHLGYSFPSGHSFFALVVYGMIAYWLSRDLPPRRRRLLWGGATFMILLVGFSRVFVGEHFPSDVAAGYAVALPWLWGCLALPTAFHRRGRDVSPEEARARYEAGKARLKEAGLLLPNLIKLVGRLVREPRVPLSRKIGLALLMGYLAMPFDLIPDFIPVLGVADDILLVSVTLGWVMKAVPRHVVTEHWDGNADLFALLDRVRAGINGLLNRE